MIKTRGRDQFKKYYDLIKALEVLFAFLPMSIKEVMWTLSDSWRGKAGLLIRFLIARTSALECGDVVYIGPYVEIRSWSKLKIGPHVSIHRGCYIDASGGISIGSNVSIAHACSLLSSDHQWQNAELPIRENMEKLAPVNIMEDVWIGCGCRILAGTIIGSRCVVGAGAVVRGEITPNSLVAGVPARLIKKI